MALVIPAVGNIGRANNLTVATQNFIAQINRARQEALTRNRSVDFQLLSASREAGEPTAYRAMRYIICDEAGSSAGSNAFPNKTMWLPQAVVITTNSSRSDLSPTLAQTNNVALPGTTSATNNGVFFTIRPNGMITTAIATNTLQWTLTAAYGDTNNFSTIQIDTRTGITRLFRP
jgi:Tfp pilus assembly protein FimT